MADPITPSTFGHLSDGHNALERRHEELKARMDVHADQMQALTAQSKKQGERLDIQGTELRANTKATQRVEKNTEEIIAFFQAGKGFFATWDWLAKKIVPIGVVGGILLTWWKGGLHWIVDQISRH